MIIKRNFKYTVKETYRKLHIYLPDNYYQTKECYPVVYFFDGHNLFNDEDATFGKSWGLRTFLDSWGKKLIIVGMECSPDGAERISEYLPYPADTKCRFADTVPLGDSTMNWIIHEIKPFIDQEYRTIPFREATGIIGSSMGGLMSLYALVQYNQWFSKAGCISTSLEFCMEPLVSNISQSNLCTDSRVYLSWGSCEAKDDRVLDADDRCSETYKRNLCIHDLLQKQGINTKMRCQIGGGHREIYWEKLVPDFMEYLWLS